MHRLSTIVLAVLIGILATATPSRAAPTAAYIGTIAPAIASYGESVTVTGIGFGGPGVIIRVNGVAATVVSATGTRVTFRVPIGVPTGPVVVTATNPGGHTGSIAFDVSGLVTLKLDEAHRVAGPIGPNGGILTAESNGRTFHLTIPAGALAQIEDIVMTPIVTIGGLPLEEFLGAVHFAPEGLEFVKPATSRSNSRRRHACGA